MFASSRPGGLPLYISVQLTSLRTVHPVYQFVKFSPPYPTPSLLLLGIPQKSMCSYELSNIFTDVPLKTNCIEHVMELTSEVQVQLKSYPLLFSSEKIVREEVIK